MLLLQNVLRLDTEGMPAPWLTSNISNILCPVTAGAALRHGRITDLHIHNIHIVLVDRPTWN